MASSETRFRRLVTSCCLLEEGAGTFSPGGLVSPALPGASVARRVGLHGFYPVLLDHPSDEGMNSLHCQLASLRGRCEWEYGATLGTATCTIQYCVMYLCSPAPPPDVIHVVYPAVYPGFFTVCASCQVWVIFQPFIVLRCFVAQQCCTIMCMQVNLLLF